MVTNDKWDIHILFTKQIEYFTRQQQQ